MPKLDSAVDSVWNVAAGDLVSFAAARADATLPVPKRCLTLRTLEPAKQTTGDEKRNQYRFAVVFVLHISNKDF